MPKKPETNKTESDLIAKLGGAMPSLEDIERAIEKKRRNRLGNWFPETGPFRRELYPKHMEFFAAGKEHRERLMMAANRVGKTVCGSFESVLHATGLYPDWWPGRRFYEATGGWACNKSAPDCRDINQLELMGQPGSFGTGMIPADRIIYTKAKPSVPDAIEMVYVRHITGGTSEIFFRSYDQGREKFQGRARHWIWADEEVPADIYTEMLLRTMTTDGIVYLTYTPVLGLTPTTIDFLTHSVNKDKLPIKFTAKNDGRVKTDLSQR